MKRSRCSLRPSGHAKDQMIERGIAKEEVISALLRGAKRVFGEKVISGFAGIEVVYKQLPCNYFVITVYDKKR